MLKTACSLVDDDPLSSDRATDPVLGNALIHTKGSLSMGSCNSMTMYLGSMHL